MSPKTILSLFDHNGAWSGPYLDAGHNVVHIDLKHDANRSANRTHGLV